MRLITSILIGAAAGSVSPAELAEQVRSIVKNSGISHSEKLAYFTELRRDVFEAMPAANRRKVAGVLESVLARPVAEMPEYTQSQLNDALAPFINRNEVIYRISQFIQPDMKRRIENVFVEIAKLLRNAHDEPGTQPVEVDAQVREFLMKAPISFDVKSQLGMCMDRSIYALMPVDNRRRVLNVLQNVLRTHIVKLPQYTSDQLRNELAPLSNMEDIISRIEQVRDPDAKSYISNVMVEMARLVRREAVVPAVVAEEVSVRELQDQLEAILQRPDLSRDEREALRIPLSHVLELPAADRHTAASVLKKVYQTAQLPDVTQEELRRAVFAIVGNNNVEYILAIRSPEERRRVSNAMVELAQAVTADLAAKPVTRAEIEAYIAQLSVYRGTETAVRSARLLADDFDDLTDLGLYKLRSFLKSEIKKCESRTCG